MIDENFTASEASDIINSLIDKKSNFSKIQRLGLTVGNHNDDCIYDNSHTNEHLEENEEGINQFIEKWKKINPRRSDFN